MTKKTNLARGIALALLTATVSGVSIFYSKISVVKIDPLVLTASRNLLVGLFFLVLMLVSGKIREVARLSKKDGLMLALIGVIGGSLPFYLFFTGLKLIGAQQGNMIHKTLFVWVGLMAFVFLKEKINFKLLVAGLLIFAGTYLFAPMRLALGQGVWLILAADMLWAVETLLAKKVLEHVSSELTGLSRMLLGGGILAVATVAGGKSGLLFSLQGSQFLMIAIGAGLLFFYVYTWFKSLSHAPASVVTLVLTWSLVVGNVLNGTFAGARLAAADWYSMLYVTGGVALAIFSLGLIAKKEPDSHPQQNG